MQELLEGICSIVWSRVALKASMDCSAWRFDSPGRMTVARAMAKMPSGNSRSRSE